MSRPHLSDEPLQGQEASVERRVVKGRPVRLNIWVGALRKNQKNNNPELSEVMSHSNGERQRSTHRSSESWRKAPRPDPEGFAGSLLVRQTFFHGGVFPESCSLRGLFVVFFLPGGWRVGGGGGGGEAFPERRGAELRLRLPVKAHRRDVRPSSVSTEFAGSADVISS